MIRAVLFDLGNTLLEYGLDGRWREFLRERLQEMHPVCDTPPRPKLSAAEFAAQVAEIIGGERAGDRAQRALMAFQAAVG